MKTKILKPIISRLNKSISQKRIKEYSAYLIPIGFLFTINKLWQTETNITILFIGTLFFFIYFFLIDSFVKEYTAKSISKIANWVLLIFIFLVIYFSFLFINGSLLYETWADYSGIVNSRFLIICLVAIILFELKKSKQITIKSILKMSILVIIVFFFCYVFKNYIYMYLLNYQVGIYGIMVLSLIGISFSYVLIELLVNWIYSIIHKMKTSN